MSLDISEKSKKNEILDAYYELLGKVSSTKSVSNQEEKQKKDNEEVVMRAASFDTEYIVNNLAKTKLDIVQGLGTLEKKLTEEYGRLNDLQAAISIETNNLKEVHEINKNADSLAALLLAQKEYKNRFDTEMMQKKENLEEEINYKKNFWKNEQELYEKDKKELELRVKKERTREEEEYRYTITMERKKDRDSYESQKNTLDKELQDRALHFEKDYAERIAAIVTQEEEIKLLRINVEKFPKELEAATKNIEKTTRESIERDYRYKMDLIAKESDGERKLADQMIVSLQNKITEHDALIRQLTVKADAAGQQVQSIAMKALESSGSRIYGIEESKKVSI